MHLILIFQHDFATIVSHVTTALPRMIEQPYMCRRSTAQECFVCSAVYNLQTVHQRIHLVWKHSTSHLEAEHVVCITLEKFLNDKVEQPFCKWKLLVGPYLMEFVMIVFGIYGYVLMSTLSICDATSNSFFLGKNHCITISPNTKRTQYHNWRTFLK